MPRIQRSTVKVAAGTFQTTEQANKAVVDPSADPDKLIYAPMKGGGQVGAIMKLKFAPELSLYQQDKTVEPTVVSLVQTVDDSLNIGTQGGQPAPVDRPAAGFNLRNAGPGVATIDQTIYPDQGDGIKNLDPRYTETRTNDTAPLSKKGGSDVGTPGYSVSSDRPLSVWKQGALLRDNPGAMNPTSLTGGMNFEVAAMVDAYNQSDGQVHTYFGGSVKWGWQSTGVNGLEPKINPTQLALADNGSASAQFFQAVTEWNQMRVPSNKGGAVDNTAVAPLQLPTGAGVTRGSQPRVAPQEEALKADIQQAVNAIGPNLFNATTSGELVALLEARCGKRIPEPNRTVILNRLAQDLGKGTPVARTRAKGQLETEIGLML